MTPTITLYDGDGTTANTTDDATVGILTLTGNADDHQNIDDIADLTITFTDDAFNVASAANITGATGPASMSARINFNNLAGPGGVNADLQFWTQANNEVYQDSGTVLATSGETVEQWNDQSDQSNHSRQTTAKQKPIYRENTINFNPALDFDGTTGEKDRLELLSRNGFSTGANPAQIFTVAKAGDHAENVQSIFSYGNAATRQHLASVIEPVGSFNPVFGFSSDGAMTTTGDYSQNRTVLQIGSHNGTRNLLSINGGTDLSDNFDGPLNVTNTNGFIGDTAFTSRNESWDGQIAEIALFSRELSLTEEQQVNSYLALKYGLTLDTNTSDYLNSAGASVYNLSSYNNDIAGVSRDNASTLDQRVSQSVNDTDGLILSTNSDFTSPNPSSRPQLTDGQALVMGHNGSAKNSFSASFDGQAIRADRVWKIENTNTVPSIHVAAPLGQLSNITSAGTPSLIVSTDETFDSSDSVYPLSYDRDNGLYSVEITDPADGSFLSIAPVPVAAQSAYYRTSSDGAVGGRTDGVTVYPSYTDFIADTNGNYVTFPQNWNELDSFFVDGSYFYRTNDTKTDVTRYPSLLDLANDTNGKTYPFTSNGSPQDWADNDEFFASNDEFYRTESTTGTSRLVAYPSFEDLVADTNGTPSPDFDTLWVFEDQFFHDGAYFLRTNVRPNSSPDGGKHFAVSRYASLEDLANSVEFDRQNFGPWSTVDDIFAQAITAALDVSETALTIDENAGTSTFTVALDARPASNVEVSVVSSDPNEATIDLATLTFTPSNWETPQTVTITGVNDNRVANDTATITVVVDPNNSNDAFDNAPAQTVDITLTDDEALEIRVNNPTGITVIENDTDGTFEVTLGSQPTDDVVVDISSNDTAVATVSPTTLTFTNTTWNTPQTVSVMGAADLDMDDESTAVNFSVDDANSDDTYDNVSDVSRDVNVTDSQIIPRINYRPVGAYDATATTFDEGIDLSTDVAGIQDVAFNNTGTKAFVAQSNTGADAIYTYDLTTPYDLTTATFAGNQASLLDNTLTPYDIEFDDDGDRLFVSIGAGRVRGYDLTTPYDVSTATYTGDSNRLVYFSLIGDPAQGFAFGDNGRSLFIISDRTDIVYRFELTNPYDYTELIGYTGPREELDISAFETLGKDVAVSEDGSRMFIIGHSEDALIQFDLASPYSITNATYAGQSQASALNVNNNDGLTFVPGGSGFYLSRGFAVGIVDRYALADTSNGFSEVASGNGVVDGQLSFSLTLGTFNDPDNDGELSVCGGGTPCTGQQVEITNLPESLVPQINLYDNDGTTANTTGDAVVGILTFSGNADVHDTTDSISNLTFEFTDAAFNEFLASEIAQATDPASSNAGITFLQNAGFDVNNPTGITVVEDTSVGAFAVSLASEPGSDVVIDVTSGDTDIATVSPDSLTFTQANWNTLQNVNVNAVSDADDNDETVVITFALNDASSDDDYAALADITRTVAITDDEEAGVTIDNPTGLALTEDQPGADLSVVLTSQPDADVTVDVSLVDTTVATLDTTQLIFTSANWDTVQTITAMAVTDPDVADETTRQHLKLVVQTPTTTG